MPKRGDELSVLLKRLAHAHRVYVRSGRLPPTSGGASGILAAVAAEVHTLVRQLYRKDWQELATGVPAPVEEIEEALEPIDGENAAALMGHLSSRCLVWPNYTFMEQAKADAVARDVVVLLGPDAQWWSSPEGGGGADIAGCTFDGFVAGTDGHRFAVLVQVGED